MAAATESKTVHSAAVTYVSMISLLTLCPPFVILLWYTMVHADGSVIKSWDYLRQNGLQGFIDIWPRPTAVAWKLIACFGAFEAALQLLLPGKRVEGPISPTGHRPVYKANGVAAYAVTLITYLSLWWPVIFDAIPTVAGFYICWGCLVWVPSVYTSPGMYLVNHPVHLGTQLALFILAAGILCIYINYDCDRQRQEFRRTNGRCLVWGKAPSKIVASYTTSSGETKQSLLLTSGCFYHTSTLYFLRSFFSTELKETMIDVDPNTGNTGKYTARRFPTGSFLESTETFINVESLTVAHFKFLGLFISDGYVRKMSAYDNVVGGKLKLKGKALDVKAGGMKKKKKHKKNHDQIAQVIEDDLSAGVGKALVTLLEILDAFSSLSLTCVLFAVVIRPSFGKIGRWSYNHNIYYWCVNTFCSGGSTEVLADPDEKETNDATKEIGEEKPAPYDDNLTPAERRYIEQRQKLDVNRLAKEANKSHRDRIQDFNQYLANMSEHYDIPKVGPG
ncbi:7-dehydrocholesterol reductase [Citrus sinensis]|nr:7-dehydrocholesterol reductase [Citrus sinensis]